MDERQGDVLEEWKQKRCGGGKKVEHIRRKNFGRIGEGGKTNGQKKKEGKKEGELHVINVNLTILQFPRLMEPKR